MARPLKTGLEYFGTDIDMDEDVMIIYFLVDIGTYTGIGALWQLLNAIYKQGYYIEWNNSVLKKLCRKKHLEKAEMETAIICLTGSKLSYAERQINSIFFNYDMYKNYNILTSKGIQKRYLLASSRRAKILFDKRFILLDYSEQVRPHSERVGKIYEMVDRKGFWTELDMKFYLLNFITNGLISDSTNGVSVDTNLITDNTNTAQIEKLQPSKKNVNKSTQRDSTVQDIDSTGHRQYKDSNIIKTPKADLSDPKQKSLYKIIESIFLSKNNDNFDNYKKEGMAIKGIITKAEKREQSDKFIQELIEKFYDLTINGNDFWKGQPFLPSALNASGIFARVEKQIQVETFEPTMPDLENMDYSEVIF